MYFVGAKYHLEAFLKVSVQKCETEQRSSRFSIFRLYNLGNSGCKTAILGGAGNHRNRRPTPKQIILRKGRTQQLSGCQLSGSERFTFGRNRVGPTDRHTHRQHACH